MNVLEQYEQVEKLIHEVHALRRRAETLKQIATAHFRSIKKQFPETKQLVQEAISDLEH